MSTPSTLTLSKLFALTLLVCGSTGGGRYKHYAPCLRLIGSCLDLASPTRGVNAAAFTCSLSADAPCLFWQEQRVVIIEYMAQVRSARARMRRRAKRSRGARASAPEAPRRSGSRERPHPPSTGGSPDIGALELAAVDTPAESAACVLRRILQYSKLNPAFC